MSDNDDLLGEDLGDQSLADYNLGNDEEDELLADEYEASSSQVPHSVGNNFESEPVATKFEQNVAYPQETYPQPEPECVVPNITVEVPGIKPVTNACYAPYDPSFEAKQLTVPPQIPATPVESPQIVPSDVPVTAGLPLKNEKRIREPRRDIPDTLDKVIVPHSGFTPNHGRTTWRNPQFNSRYSHPYRRNNMPRGNFQQRPSFPPPQQIRPESHGLPEAPRIPEITIERPNLPENPPMPQNNQPQFMERPRYPPRFQNQQNFGGPRQQFFRPPPFNRFGPPKDMPQNIQIPQITIRQQIPPPNMMPGGKIEEFPPKLLPGQQEVRMLPVQLPTNIPPVGLAGKKVLINPHFKGNFQPPVEGPIQDIDDAAERFIAEQRNALARAAARKAPRRSPQRFIENTTIEIVNELAPKRSEDDDLLRRQEEFINANRAGLRRRMRTPTPPRRSPSPRRRERRDQPDDEETDYKRRLREQESLRERVLRAKEVRRRKNAVALQKQIDEREKSRNALPSRQISQAVDRAPDTTVQSPERHRSPIKDKAKSVEKSPEVNSTEVLTPPRIEKVEEESPERNLTPPLPAPVEKSREKTDSDDELDLILDDIDGILSDEDDSGRFKHSNKNEAPKSKTQTDLRSRLPPKSENKNPVKQRITFTENKPEKRKKEKSPPRKNVVTSSTKEENVVKETKTVTKSKPETESKNSKRQRIIFENKEKEKEKPKPQEEKDQKSFSNRRVVLQRKVQKNPLDNSVFSRIEVRNDPTQPTLGIFSKAVRTAIGADKHRIVVQKHEPEIEYGSDSENDEKVVDNTFGFLAVVTNLPHGMTDTRMKTLAGNDVQNLELDRKERTANIHFKTTIAAENFKKKFNNKMVAASRLTVVIK